MADDKKTISPDVGTPTETPEQPNPAPDLADTTAPAPLGPEELTVEEQLILEHEGQAALFEMGEAVPDPADAVTHAEVEEPAAPEVPKAEKEQEQPPDPGKDAPAPAHSGKVVDFAAARDEAAKEEKKAVKQKPPTEKDKAAKPGKGRPPKADKAAPDTSSVEDIINLVHNLDCYDLHPGVTDDETLGRIYVEDMELLDVPDNVLPYFDFEAYGRDMRINEGGHFAPTGYLTRSGDFKEVYHGIEDIPAEHRIFAYPKLNIREQMAAYKEIIDRSSLEGERLHPRKEHDDR